MDPWQIVAVLAAALGSTWGVFIAGFFKGDLVPGHVYRREVKRADTATLDASKNKRLLEEALRLLRGWKPDAPPPR